MREQAALLVHASIGGTLFTPAPAGLVEVVAHWPAIMYGLWCAQPPSARAATAATLWLKGSATPSASAIPGALVVLAVTGAIAA